MAALGASEFTVYEADTGLSNEAGSPFAMKELIVTTAATADNGDTMDIDVSKYGMSKVAYVKGFSQTTSDSVVIREAPTTSVASTTLTITIGGATANKRRVFIVGGY